MEKVTGMGIKALLVVLLLAACKGPPPPPPEPTEAPDWVKEAVERSKAPRAHHAVAPEEPAVELFFEKMLWWQVKAPSGATSHLLGTFHLATDFAKLEALPADVQAAFESATTLVFEADTGDAEVREQLIPYMLAPPGQSLRDKLKPIQWETLVREAKRPEDELAAFRPWVVLSMLMAAWLPSETDRPMDDRFRILGLAHGKQLMFLETLDEQAKLISKTITVPAIADILDDVPQAKMEVQSAFDAFRRGDADTLATLTFDTDHAKKYPIEEAVLYQRNAAWIPLLTPHLEAGGALVIVGVGHLLRDRSVVALLADKGYDVSRIE